MKKIVILIIIFGLVGFGATYFYPHKQVQTEKTLPIQQVSLLKDKAVPDFVTIHPGESVQFNSKDGKEHIMAHGRGDGYGDAHNHDAGADSPVIHPDEGYRVLFKKVGTYEFHDHENPKIYVTVLVFSDSKK